MPINLSDTLVVAITSTALFDLSEPDEFYRNARASDGDDEAIRKYRKLMFETENEQLLDGTGLPVVQALLNLNKFEQDNSSPLVQVVVMSRNSPETGMRILNNIRSKELDIPRTVFTGGETVTDYLSAYSVDLFLTTDKADAQKVADTNTCAVALLREPPILPQERIDEQVRIAFDGDAVLFDEQSELVYKNAGLPDFLEHEKKLENVPMTEGPYASLLKKLSRLQERLPFQMEHSPIRIAIVTARNAPADIRVIKTLRSWGVYADAAFFMGGLEKTDVLKALKPHIFFDDQDIHLDKASTSIASGKVPYRTGSSLMDIETSTSSEAKTKNKASFISRLLRRP